MQPLSSDPRSSRNDSAWRARAPRFSDHVLRAQPILLLAVLGARAAGTAERSLAEHGIDSREFAILEYLAHAVGPVPQATLGFRLGRDRTTVMRLTRSLTAKGLVSPVPDPRDGRVRAVEISEAGQERYRMAEENLFAAAEKAFWLLSGEECDQLVELLLRVL